MPAPVAVVGGGTFGRGLAKALARTGRDVIVWSRTRRDSVDEHVHTTNDLAHVRDATLVFVAIPSARAPDVVPPLGDHLDGSHLLVHVSRGLVGDDLRTLTRYLRDETPCRRVGALAGPLVAQALADGTPGGAIVGTLFPEVSEAVREALAGPALRVYSTDDVIGVEVGSALVGLLALGLGFAQGIGMGPSTLAVFLTRGVAEVARIGVSLGAREKTFMGLAGTGDLLAAVAGDGRPEIELGRALARGMPVDEAVRTAGANIEGISLARRVAVYAARQKIDAPVCQITAEVLDGKVTPADAIATLMARRVTSE